ncbi:sulfotransferase [Uliginosibacterium sp. 31-16]|uniref:tetratricopeptide repeat-containing sulfotransferase family protein n=1 Tax=Uliginosibacterium sp. 31-16 TaxID=3068315 RepID=UPI00273F38ED|nr:sulfotransferase [Uliginosibacterium sp. 31-16]MDP5238954.1 sulfotransferase [Uliginosibacterium sp. 31-16]
MLPPEPAPVVTVEQLIAQCLAQYESADRAGALTRLQAMTTAYPDHPGVWEALARVLRHAGCREEAVVALRQWVVSAPDSHDAHTDLAGLLHELGNKVDVEYHARRALALNPLNAQAHNLLGMLALDDLRAEEAEFHFRQLLLLHEPLAPLCANLATALQRQGKLDEAAAIFSQMLELDPANVDGCISWARMEEARRNFSRAWELLAHAERIAPLRPNVVIARAVLLRREKQPEAALAVLDTLGKSSARLMPDYLRERGEVLDRLGRYPEAFAAYSQAKALIHANRPGYDAAAQQQLAVRLKQVFTRHRMAPVLLNLPAVQTTGTAAQPLFIIGFPRSGTTLTEQILASHPQISAGDELDFIHRLSLLGSHLCASPQPYPECMLDLARPGNGAAIETFRHYYLCNAQLAGVIEPGRDLFTDKMPLNEVNLGLIYLAFPQAPIVHLLRHPLDVVLSTFFTDLSHGGHCGDELVSAAQHYALAFDLIQHYRRELDLNYLAVRYEDLVTDPEPHVRRLLDFIGKPFDARCLAFHENTRTARTASYAQVSEKLYTRSRYRYRNYLPQLEAVLPILRPAIEQLGYEV